MLIRALCTPDTHSHKMCSVPVLVLFTSVSCILCPVAVKIDADIHGCIRSIHSSMYMECSQCLQCNDQYNILCLSFFQHQLLEEEIERKKAELRLSEEDSEVSLSNIYSNFESKSRHFMLEPMCS